MLIEHAEYGRGEILKRRYGGFELYVAFDDGISRWVKIMKSGLSQKAPSLQSLRQQSPK